MPRSRVAFKSTLSNPTPARAIKRRCGAWSRTRRVIGLEPAKRISVNAANNKLTAKPTEPEATPDEKKRVYNADTNPGTIFTNSIDMELVRLPAGYWASKFEVTQKQYKKVMEANPSAFPGDDRPVDSVSRNFMDEGGAHG